MYKCGMAVGEETVQKNKKEKRIRAHMYVRTRVFNLPIANAIIIIGKGGELQIYLLMTATEKNVSYRHNIIYVYR